MIIKKKKYKKIIVLFIGVLFLIFSFFLYSYIRNKELKEIEERNLFRAKLTEEIKSHYSNYVKTNKETALFDEKLNEVGILNNDVELVLEEQEIDYNTKFFVTAISDKNYYIKYQDVDKIDVLSSYSDRYKNYIVFNENIVTKDKTSFYDDDNNLVYEFNQSFNLPIIIKDFDRYGVEFQNRLLYIKKDDVLEVSKQHNTDLSNTKGVPVLNYHFIYNVSKDGVCNEEICHSEKQITEQFSYIKDNNFFSLTMRELEMYIDGKIQLPKSVMITFDDGTLAHNARDYVNKFELNATLFLITSWFDKEQFESEYLEVHSHGHDLHNPGVCSGGQGGAIKCLEREKLLDDLRTSRAELNNTTYFCYPFYEYNNYSIEVLKEAGYTMAFVGESRYSDNLVKVGSNKFKLPRFVVVDYTTMRGFINYLNVD